jgi:rod shape-determining protein MreD
VGAGPGHRHHDNDHYDNNNHDDRAGINDHDRGRIDFFVHARCTVTRVIRIGALIALLTVMQVAVFPHLRLLGAVPDLGLLLAIAVAFRDGPEAGLVTGFFAGVAFDLFLETPVGLTALAYALTAYATGVLQTGVLRSPRMLSPLAGFLGGLVSGMLFVVVGVLAGANVAFTDHTFALLLASALYDAVLAPLVFWLTDRVLGDRDPASARWAR